MISVVTVPTTFRMGEHDGAGQEIFPRIREISSPCSVGHACEFDQEGEKGKTRDHIACPWTRQLGLWTKRY